MDIVSDLLECLGIVLIFAGTLLLIAVSVVH